MYVKELDLFVTVMLLEDTPAVLSLGILCEDHGYSYHWTICQKPHLIKNGKKIECNTANYVPIVVPGLSTSSSSSATPTSPTSLPQEAATTTQHPASTRSESTSGIERVREDPSRGPAEIKNPNKNEDNERVRRNPLRDLPVDDSVPEHRDVPASSSRESSSEARGKEVSGKHSIYAHFPKDKNCDICLRTKIFRAPCRRRIGGAVPRAEYFGDLITADHKNVSEGCESRNNHRCAVLVQDLATQWIQSYPCETKTSQETQRSLQKFLEPNRKPKVIYTDNSLEFGKACEDLSWNHCTSTPHQSETNGIAERALRRIKEETSAVLLQSGLDETWWADAMEG